MPKFLRLFALVVFAAALALIINNGCSKKTTCIDGISSSTLNTDKSLCSNDCECNNLKYHGFCQDGSCVSVPRDPCSKKGIVDGCKGVLAPHCEGIHVCAPAPLTDLVWGDCVCKKSEKNESEKELSDAGPTEKKVDSQHSKKGFAQPCESNEDCEESLVCGKPKDSGKKGCFPECVVAVPCRTFGREKGYSRAINARADCNGTFCFWTCNSQSGCPDGLTCSNGICQLK